MKLKTKKRIFGRMLVSISLLALIVSAFANVAMAWPPYNGTGDITPIPCLGMTKEASNTTVSPGDSVFYTYEITNNCDYISSTGEPIYVWAMGGISDSSLDLQGTNLTCENTNTSKTWIWNVKEDPWAWGPNYPPEVPPQNHSKLDFGEVIVCTTIEIEINGETSNYAMVTGEMSGVVINGDLKEQVGVYGEASETVNTVTGRMTGGGNWFNALADGTDDVMKVTHGFQLHCDDQLVPNSLEINWGTCKNSNKNCRSKVSEKFHLLVLTDSHCKNDSTIDAGHPDAPINTYYGEGIGIYNNQLLAKAEWIFSDAGEPGINDRAKVIITLYDGTVVLDIDNNLNGGNHQAHKDDKKFKKEQLVKTVSRINWSTVPDWTPDWIANL